MTKHFLALTFILAALLLHGGQQIGAQRTLRATTPLTALHATAAGRRSYALGESPVPS